MLIPGNWRTMILLLGMAAASITVLGVGVGDDAVTRSALALCDVPACRQVYLNARDSLKSAFEAPTVNSETRALIARSIWEKSRGELIDWEAALARYKLLKSVDDYNNRFKPKPPPTAEELKADTVAKCIDLTGAGGPPAAASVVDQCVGDRLGVASSPGLSGVANQPKPTAKEYPAQRLVASAAAVAAVSAPAKARRARQGSSLRLQGPLSAIPQRGSCACGTGKYCVGPRGGVFCYTAAGNKNYH